MRSHKSLSLSFAQRVPPTLAATAAIEGIASARMPALRSLWLRTQAGRFRIDPIVDRQWRDVNDTLLTLLP